MELVEGPTLAERITEGPMPMDEALHVAGQIADALQAAHDSAIVHRDLKPGNVKIKPDGVVKVLDFGLAKVGPTPSAPSENSPTLSMAATQAGMILGTAGYMSPEQARGKPVDKRADIWAFGVVLYEMLTGHRLFEGEDVVETLAAVVHKEPDWKLAPPRVQRVLQRCLVKDPKKRLRDISGVGLLLEEGEPKTSRGWSPALLWGGWAAAAVAAIAAIVVWAPWRTAETPEVVRFQVPPPEKATFLTSPPVLSPDGKKLAFIANSGTQMVWVRPLDTLEARPLPGTEGAAAALFWSPDSRSIAYWNTPAPFKLKRVEVAGGPPQTLCETPADPSTGAWSPDGVIIFHNRGLMRVPAGGGECTPLTALDAVRDEAGHRFPSFLPDGRHFVYLRESGKPENAGIYVGSLDAKPEQQSSKRVLAADGTVVYAAVPGSKNGYLLFRREGTLMAQPFDPGRLELSGDAVPAAEQVGGGNNFTGGYFSASATGALAFRTGAAGGVGNLQVTVFDRQGKVTGTAGELGNYTEPAFSPDGTQVAFVRFDNSGGADIWLHEFARGVSTRFTFDPARDRLPVWSPDGKQIIYSSERDGGRNLYRKVATGAGTEELVFKSNEPKQPTDWSRDGRFLLFTNVDSKTVDDIWVLPVGQTISSSAKPEVYLKTEFLETNAKFSPDGRFVAYQSNSSGGAEVYVQTFPDPKRGRWQVSKGGGVQPHWRRDGKELFYRGPAGGGGALMAVDIMLAPAFKAGIPRMLFTFPPGQNPWDVTTDGQKFIRAVQPTAAASGAPPEPITIVLNWAAGLRK